MRKGLYLLIVFLMLTEVMSVMVYAGEWKREPGGWRWKKDDGSYLAGSWEWLDGNHDGVYKRYYFNKNGYMMTDAEVSDGSFINEDGAWVLDGEIQTRQIAADVIDQSKVAEHILVMTNQERKRYGLSELTINEELKGNGQIRAKELKRSFDHTRPDGRPFHTALTINYTRAGENIIYSQAFDRITEEELAQKFVSSWLDSDLHRKNILAPEWEQTAISVYIEENNVYVVQLFFNR